MASSATQVLIIGAGPTGLSMAVELERLGISFRIIDKRIKPVKTSNALGVQTRTLEVWDDLGIVDQAIALGLPIHGINLFAGFKKMATINFNLLNSHFHFLLALSQHHTEAMLLEYLSHKQIAVEMEVDVKDLVIDKQIVTANVAHRDGRVESIQANWLVACDGAHSFVREKCQIPFSGEELPQHFVLADMEAVSALSQDQFNLFTSAKGILAILPFDKQHTRIIADVTHDDELKQASSLTYSQVERLIKERCPLPVEVTALLWTSGFWIHARRIKQFRLGNVFFAGDAAHIHSPAGGQGMNTGIQDVYNLAWKLALVIQDKAKSTLLDTYSQERSAVAKQVLTSTTLLTKVMTSHNFLLKWFRNLVFFFIAKNHYLSSKLVNTLAQLNIHYSENLIVKDYMAHTSGPQPGTRMQDVMINRERLFDYVRGSQINMLCFLGADDKAALASFNELIMTLEKSYGKQIKFILIHTQQLMPQQQAVNIWDKDKQIHHCYGANQACFYIIRPDKYIGFRGKLEHANHLRKWLACFLKLNSNL